MGKVALETTVSTKEPERPLAALAPYRPLEVVVETCPFWPWLYDLLVPAGIGFHLAHAKQLRAIAAAPQKSDAVDARLLARMLLSGLIPEAYPRSADQRELLRLLRHRTTLVRYRTRLAGRIHSQLHQQRLSLPREQGDSGVARGDRLAPAHHGAAGDRHHAPGAHRSPRPVDPRPRAAHRDGGGRPCHRPALGDDPRDRPVSEPALGGRARPDHAVPPR